MAEEKQAKTEREPSEFSVHMGEAVKSMGKQWGSLIPAEFWEHGRDAQRHTLLAVRAVLTNVIDRLDPEGTEGQRQASTPRKAKVQVE